MANPAQLETPELLVMTDTRVSPAKMVALAKKDIQARQASQETQDPQAKRAPLVNPAHEDQMEKMETQAAQDNPVDQSALRK